MSFGPEPDPPLHGFFRRAESLATAAFRAIPYVGDDIAGFFLNTVVPFCTPKRDRFLVAVVRRLKALEGGLQLILMRALPLPEDPERGARSSAARQCFFGVTARNGYGVPLPSPNGSASSTQK